MTDGERRAFEAGYCFGTEDQITAHDGLFALVVRYEIALALAVGRPELECDQRVVAVMGRVRRARFDGEVAAGALYELERAMEVGR